ncbi:MAG TPA: VOC family protein [Phenylobacterium sp.]|jgi:catechol 2,3-dioxygenase-like lactoylglutathione lyase family enzyme|uniref:VOC family protein n=1 Tax=Phenylobacterium conjunctum TaxID=1298959 RepID=A0ABW3T4D6_9CAUL|nr:VOC family protein [Phenylobacterium sp.]
METVSIRYIVADVDAAAAFYRDLLGFAVDFQAPGAFAMLSRGVLKLMLNRPGAGGAGAAMPDGETPAPGGWNRFQLVVSDLAAEVQRLKAAGASFRNEIVQGNGGQQILLKDPSGNLIELFQPPGG